MNEREVEFVKNDNVRVKVVCRKKSGLAMLVNKVDDNHTFKVKTLVDTYKCGRVFANRNENKKWVSKVVLKNLGL